MSGNLKMILLWEAVNVLIASLMGAVTYPLFEPKGSASFCVSFTVTHSVAVPVEIFVFSLKGRLRNLNGLSAVFLILPGVVLLNAVQDLVIMLIYPAVFPCFSENTIPGMAGLFTLKSVLLVLVPALAFSVSLSTAAVLVDRFMQQASAVPQTGGSSFSVREEFTAGNFTVKEGEDYYRIAVSDIIYIQAHGSRCVIHCTERSWTVSRNLGDLLKSPALSVLLRIHKSTAVNPNYIKKTQYYIGGRFRVFLSDEDDTELTVGRKYADSFRKSAGIQ